MRSRNKYQVEPLDNGKAVRMLAELKRDGFTKDEIVQMYESAEEFAEILALRDAIK